MYVHTYTYIYIHSMYIHTQLYIYIYICTNTGCTNDDGGYEIEETRGECVPHCAGYNSLDLSRSLLLDQLLFWPQNCINYHPKLAGIHT